MRLDDGAYTAFYVAASFEVSELGDPVVDLLVIMSEFFHGDTKYLSPYSSR